MTFLVAGSDSPGYSTNRPTSNTTWPGAITPDQLMAGQASADGGPYARLGLADGSVQTAFAMPDYNPNTAPVSLLYSSTAANAQPLFLAEYQLPTGQSVPSTITAQLTFNGTPGSTVYYNTSSLNAGDWVQIALQASATSLSTGRYSYQITVTNGTNTNYSGNVNIVNQGSSAYGSGWSLGGVEQIVSATGGVILVQPGGSSLWFANGVQAGTFVTPAGDFSTLTQNTQNNTYQRTLPDGTQINFTSGGLQTSVVDRDGNTTSYSYSGSQLTAITDLNSQQTTLAYNGSGKLTSITDPAGRAATLAYNASGQLTSITDPASAAWQYGYDTSSRMTTLTDPRSNATSFSYDFAGRVTGVTRPDSTTASLAPLQINGLATPGTGTSGNPATAVLLATGDQAQYTDPASNVWTTGLDWLGFGKDVQNADPLSDTSLIYRDSNGLPWLSADPLGRRTREFFDSKGNVTKVVAPDDTTQQYQYNSSFSEVTQYTDQLSNLTTYSYNAKGDLTQLTDALNHSTTFAFNAAGLVTSTTDPLNHTTTSAYDSLNRLTRVTDALSGVTTYSYDSASNLTATTDARGFTSTFSYDLMGRQTGATRQVGTGVYVTSTVAYDKVGNQTSVTDPLNHTSTFGFDTMNRRTAATDALGHQVTYGYDSRGNQTAVTDALHRQTTYGYDAANRLTAATDPLGDQTTYGYDVAGEKTISTDPLGRQTTFSYTQKGQVSIVTDPAGAQLTYGYDAAGNETGVTEVAASQGLGPGGQSSSTTMAYNALGRETATTDPLNNQTTFALDADGNRTSMTDALGHQTTFAYDALNRLTATSDALGHQVTYGYDARSQQTAVTDALTHQTTYGFDGLGRQTAVTDPRGGQTTYGYDLAGNLTALTDSVGNQTTYSYDAANRLTNTTDPLGHATTSAYDVANQLTSTTDRDGRTKTMAYDAAGRLTNLTWVGGSYTATYTYDKDGEVTEAQDPFSQYTMTYNAAGLVKSVDNGGTPGVPHVSLTMAYDGFLNRTSLTDNLGGQVSFGYDLAHKLTSDELFLNSAWKANVTIGYDAASRLTGITRTAPRGHTITSSLGYDNADRLTNITHQDATVTVTLDSYTYGYDNANRLTSYQDGNSSLTYGYDNANELTSASGTLNGSSFHATYSYDLNGNRNMSGYSTGTGNELKSDGTYSYTYDNEGNLTTQTTIASGSVTYYSYDYRNLLTEAKQEDSHGTVLNDEKFTYDIHGNRIGVSNNGTQQSYTVFDGSNPYIDFNGSGTLTERYLTNPQGLSQFYARVDGSGTVNWYLTDNIQSVRQIVDAVGNVQDKLVYDPFGSIVSETNAVNGDRFKYTGGQYDSITSNDQFGARAYGPWVGRFWSQDPLSFGAGDTNLYRYVGDSPTDRRDPTGEGDGDLPNYPPVDFSRGKSIVIASDGEGSMRGIPEENTKRHVKGVQATINEIKKYENGSLSAIVLAGHGDGLGTAGGIGLMTADPDDWRLIASKLDKDGVLVWAGCKCGMNTRDVVYLAKKMRRTVMANDGDVKSNGRGLGQWIIGSPDGKVTIYREYLVPINPFGVDPKRPCIPSILSIFY
jgi:RHS repeat-associated protein